MVILISDSTWKVRKKDICICPSELVLGPDQKEKVGEVEFVNVAFLAKHVGSRLAGECSDELGVEANGVGEQGWQVGLYEVFDVMDGEILVA